MGFEIEEYKASPQPAPYKLLVKFHHGKILVQAEGHNPTEVRAAEKHVARNAKVIESIVLHDNSGPLETIWRHTW